MKNFPHTTVVVPALLFMFVFCAPLSAEYDKIDINTAGAEELVLLPDIGPAKAERIIRQRELAPFERIEDITLVNGINRSTFEMIRDKITVGDGSSPEKCGRKGSDTLPEFVPGRPINSPGQSEH